MPEPRWDCLADEVYADDQYECDTCHDKGTVQVWFSDCMADLPCPNCPAGDEA